MKRFLTLLLTVITSISAYSQGEQQQMPNIPIDPAVTIGKLENGLTYYIRHNEEPKGQANFYIAQKVGSILEEDNQRGLAHFLEHMCFNGTEKFPENEIVKYCERIGVKFGADLNAYTSIDETVYNIDNVPVDKFPTAIDSCLWILHDWADGLLLNGDDIDHERGVIHEEWRSRTSASMRMYDSILPKVYQNDRYAYRLPIGTMEVVDNFPYQAIRDYYHKWYRPDLQGIVVVGDIDVKEVENKIKEIFGTIKKPVNPAKRIYFPVEDNKEPIIAIAKDKEQPYSIGSIAIKHDAYPDEQKTSFKYLVYDYAVGVIHSMLSARLQELVQKPNPPFIQGSISNGEFVLSKTKEAFEGTVVSSEDGLKEAYTTIYREMLRAIRGGFTESEYDRAKAQFMANLESSYNQRDKRKSGGFCKEYVRNFIDNEPIPGIEIEYEMAGQFVPQIPLEVINQIVASWGNTDGNLVAFFMLPDKEGVTYPTENEIKESLKAVEAEDIPAYVDDVLDKPLISNMPQPGKVGKAKDFKFGFKKYILSNGAQLYFRQSDLNKDQILMSASSKGGTSLYPESESNELKSVSDVLTIGGVGEFNSIELRKALAGKKVHVSPNIGLFSESVSGSSTPKDIETMFQLTYLYFTQLRSDNEAFESWKSRAKDAIKNRDSDPGAALQDSICSSLYLDQTRFSEQSIEDIDNLDYARMMEIAKERFSNAGDFRFVITGNIDEATLLPLIEKYIASLPSVKKTKEQPNLSVYCLRNGGYNNYFETKMETPSVTNLFVDKGKVSYTLMNRLSFSIALQCLRITFTEEIREKEGGTYGVSCGGSIGGYPTEVSTMQISYQTGPEKYEHLNERIREIVAEFGLVGASEENIAKCKEYMIKKYHENLKENSFYMSSLTDYLDNDVDQIDLYEDTVNSITNDDIKFIYNLLLDQNNHIEVVQIGTK